MYFACPSYADSPFQQEDLVVEVARCELASGEDEVELVLVELRLLDVHERPHFRCPVRQEVALGDGERALEDPLRFRQMCS